MMVLLLSTLLVLVAEAREPQSALISVTSKAARTRTMGLLDEQAFAQESEEYAPSAQQAIDAEVAAGRVSVNATYSKQAAAARAAERWETFKKEEEAARAEEDLKLKAMEKRRLIEKWSAILTNGDDLLTQTSTLNQKVNALVKESLVQENASRSRLAVVERQQDLEAAEKLVADMQKSMDGNKDLVQVKDDTKQQALEAAAKQVNGLKHELNKEQGAVKRFSEKAKKYEKGVRRIENHKRTKTELKAARANIEEKEHAFKQAETELGNAAPGQGRRQLKLQKSFAKQELKESRKHVQDIKRKLRAQEATAADATVENAHKTETTSGCMGWCADHRAPWGQKCRWKKKSCSGCVNCAMLAAAKSNEAMLNNATDEIVNSKPVALFADASKETEAELAREEDAASGEQFPLLSPNRTIETQEQISALLPQTRHKHAPRQVFAETIASNTSRAQTKPAQDAQEHGPVQGFFQRVFR